MKHPKCQILRIHHMSSNTTYIAQGFLGNIAKLIIREKMLPIF